MRIYIKDIDGDIEPAIVDQEHKMGMTCLMCGTKKKPVAGRCVVCSYMWARSDRILVNWHEYTPLTYKAGTRRY